MALKQTLELESGIVGEYWNISSIEYLDNHLNVGMNLFINHEARDSGKQPIKSQSFRMVTPKELVIESSLFTLAYSKLKELHFPMAEDV